MSKQYFTYRSLDGNVLDKYVIVPADYDNFPFKITNTKTFRSYGIIEARLLGLDYVTYVRFLRDLFPKVVTLKGKSGPIVIPVWKLSNELLLFINFLNKKMELTIKENESKRME